LVVEGGIGNTIDRLMLCKNMFDTRGVNLAGVIVNKVLPSKLEKVSYYLHKFAKRKGFQILGVIPLAPELAYPTIFNVAKAIKADMLCGHNRSANLIEDIIAGSLIDLTDLNTSKSYLLVVSARRLTAAMTKLRNIWRLKNLSAPNLAGVVITGDAHVSDDWLGYLSYHNIPTLHTMYDTYESVIKISHLNVKLNAQTPQKIVRAVQLFEKYAFFDRITALLNP